MDTFVDLVRLERQNSFSHVTIKICPPLKSIKLCLHFMRRWTEEKFHREVADKAFEEKCRSAMIKFLNTKGIAYRELQRKVTEGGIPVAEWETIFGYTGMLSYSTSSKINS